METSPFGKSGLRASRIGLGCMSLTAGFYGSECSETEASAVIRRAVELGVTLFNTAGFYGPFVNELLLGKVLGEDRHRMVLTTKWSATIHEDGSVSHDFSPEYCRAACDESLKRLEVESLGLFIMRGPFRSDRPIEDTAQALKELLQQGKIKGVGLSECEPDDVRRVHAIVPVTALELEWSLFTRDCEADLIPLCRELGIAIMAYSPLGRGLLTGKVTKESVDSLAAGDFRKTRAPHFASDNLDKNLLLVANVTKMAERKGCTPGQLALAWLLAQGPDVFPIPGTKRVAYLEENVAAAAIHLTPEEVKELESLVPPDAIAGDRYADMDKLAYRTNKAGAGGHAKKAEAGEHDHKTQAVAAHH